MMRLRWTVWAALCGGLLLAAVPPARAEDSRLAPARARMAAKDAAGAYKLLLPMEPERAGDPEFDLLLGTAALDAGRPTEAVFALERVLSVQPDNAAARAAIGRAYFAIRETDNARNAFEAVKRSGDAGERKRADEYLGAIDRLAVRDKLATQFYLEFAAGWDSNANSATALNQVAVPSFGNTILTLTKLSQAHQDGFASMTGGMSFSAPLAQGLGLVGGLSGSKRVGIEQPDLGTGYLDGYIGLSKVTGRDTFTAIAQGNMFFLDDPSLRYEYRDAVGGTLQWTRDIDGANQVTAYAQYASLSYPEQTGRDASRYIFGLGYSHTFPGGNTSLYGGAYGGEEVAKNGAYSYLGHNPVGLRLGLNQRITDDTSLFFTTFGERRDYRGTDPSFLVDRRDLQLAGTVGVRLGVTKGWVVSPQVSYTNTRSNVPINQFDQTQVFVTARKEF